MPAQAKKLIVETDLSVCPPILEEEIYLYVELVKEFEEDKTEVRK